MQIISNVEKWNNEYSTVLLLAEKKRIIIIYRTYYCYLIVHEEGLLFTVLSRLGLTKVISVLSMQ